MEASTSSSLPNEDVMREGDVVSDLQTLKKLYGLLDTISARNSPESSQEILDHKSKVFLMKLLDDATQQTLKRQAVILPGSIIPPSLSDQNESRCGLKNKTNLTPLPSFHKLNPQFSFKNRRGNQSPCIKNCAPSRAIVNPNRTTKTNTISKEKHKEKLSSGYNTAEPAQKRTRTDKIKKDENSDKRSPHARKTINIKGKSRESLPDSKTSGSDSCSHSSCGIGPLPIVPIAKRPLGYKKIAQRPSPNRLSKSPVNLPNEPDNKPLTRLPSNRNKTLTKMPSHHYSKTPNKSPSHHNIKALTRMPSHHNDKALIKMPSHHKKKIMQKQYEKEPEKKKKETKESRFKRLKNKLAVVFHHHHHHHHHHHGSSSEEGDDKEHQKHRSPWKFLKGMIHRPSERMVEIVPAHHHYMRELFSAMISHLWGNRNKKKKKVKEAKRGHNKRKTLHWWQRFKKRGGVKLTNGKKTRLRLGFNSGRKASLKKDGKH